MLSTQPPAPRFISAQPWFASVPAALQERLRDEVFAVQGDKGAVMMPAGSAVEGWHAVLSGLVMLQSPASKGRSSAFIGVPDGEWFGEGSAMKPEPRKYNVVALRPTTLLCLPLPLFATLRESSLAFNQFLVQHLNMRLGQAMTIIEAGRTQSPEHRVALYLSRLFWRSTRRLNLTQDELGQLVGLSRQTVNRVLRTLEELGIVSLDFGKVAIVDDEALGAYLAATAAA
ncbi:Crp/Fnr family transcriptional regulator [Acidovorax kalamii]|jgi:CRP-like cAMP-binding protein|uniref:Crp/Fnr family transcriptional regulator n=1 Tax=Acidovorax kalamii TaxID=2004485 RepID=A0A235EI74_9BURK|nr:Crp/Fnr family transcriptional regulator [Acidovorax kalamii]MCO5358223.1 Crp/Fnr family transcriptional regulator [Acidovorax kalamii]OYD48756.1 Crp/Fnr family transcriptional regulator [Acidovorax kalamii]